MARIFQKIDRITSTPVAFSGMKWMRRRFPGSFKKVASSKVHQRRLKYRGVQSTKSLCERSTKPARPRIPFSLMLCDAQLVQEGHTGSAEGRLELLPEHEDNTKDEMAGQRRPCLVWPPPALRMPTRTLAASVDQKPAREL